VEHTDTQTELAKNKQQEQLKQREIAKKMFAAGGGGSSTTLIVTALVVLVVAVLLGLVAFAAMASTGAIAGPAAEAVKSKTGMIQSVVEKVLGGGDDDEL
jgi:hypothetical protein